MARPRSPEKGAAEAVEAVLALKSRMNWTDEALATWRAANPEKIKAWTDAYAKAHPEAKKARWRNRQARLRGRGGKHTGDQIIALAKRQKYQCANPACGKSIRQKYHADHIRPLARGGDNFISNIQLLCPNCNLRKHTKDPVVWARENGLLL